MNNCICKITVSSILILNIQNAFLLSFGLILFFCIERSRNQLNIEIRSNLLMTKSLLCLENVIFILQILCLLVRIRKWFSIRRY